MAEETYKQGDKIEPWHPRMRFEIKMQVPHFKKNLRKTQ